MENYTQSPEEIKEIIDITNKAIDVSITNAHEDWRNYAIECLKTICLAKETFTVAEVRDLVKLGSVKTHDNRAMGGIMRTGLSNGWITPTGMSIPSKIGHKSPIQIWRSKIHNI